MKASISNLSTDFGSYTLGDKEKIDEIVAAFNALTTEEQAQIDTEVVKSLSSQPLGRVLESAQWAVYSQQETDNTTLLANGTYASGTTPALTATFGNGKSTSGKTKWDISEVTVNNGKAYATVTVSSSSVEKLQTSGAQFDMETVTNSEGANEYVFKNVPVDLNATMYFLGYSSKMNAWTAYSIATEIAEPEALDATMYALEGFASTDSSVAFDDTAAFVSIKAGENASEPKLVIRLKGVGEYDYIWKGEAANRPEATATDQMLEGVPVAGKVTYFELPLTDAEALNGNVPFVLHKVSGAWASDETQYFTWTKSEAVTGLVGKYWSHPSLATIKELADLVNAIPNNAGEADLDAYVEAAKAYIDLDYNCNSKYKYARYEFDKQFVDIAIPEIKAALVAADESIPNVRPAAGTYEFLMNLNSEGDFTAAEGFVSDRLYSVILTVPENDAEDMTVQIAQRRGSYGLLFVGSPSEALAAVNGDGPSVDDGFVDFMVEKQVFIDNPDPGVDSKGRVVADAAGVQYHGPDVYTQDTATISLKSLEKPVALTWYSSSMWSRPFIFHQINMVPQSAISTARQIIGLLNYPSDASVLPYQVDPATINVAASDAVQDAVTAYNKLGDTEKACLDNLLTYPELMVEDESLVHPTATFGWALQNAELGLAAQGQTEVDDSTSLADGFYTNLVTVEPVETKAASADACTWTIAKLEVAGGKAVATLQSDKSSYTEVTIAGKTYENIAADGAASQFEVPIDLNSAMVFLAKSSNEAVPFAYQLSTAIDETSSAPATPIDVPKAKTGLKYTGKSQAGVAENDGYVLSGVSSATNAGNYVATVEPAKGYTWVDGTVAPVEVAWAIVKGAPTITATNKSVAMGKTVNLGAKVNSGAALTYKSSNTKVAKVNAKGVVTPVKAGNATITISAAAKGNYAAASKAVKVTVKQGAQTLTFKKQSKKVTYKKVKKAKQTVKITKAKGNKTTVTYSITKAVKDKKSAKSKFSINKKTGQITVKKGAAKGTYKVTVKAAAKKTANWAGKSKTAVITIKVK